MRVKVTRKHIKKGTPGSSSCCALALALQEALDAQRVGVVDCPPEVTVVSKNGLGTKHRLPRGAAEFIKHFDRHEHVEPQEFEFDDQVLGVL